MTEETVTDTVDDQAAGAVADGGDDTGSDATAGSSQAGDPAADAADALLTDDEYQSLQEKHKDDPGALRAALQSAFTKKTQGLSAVKKFIRDLNTNPDAVIEAMAKRRGFSLSKPSKAAPTNAEIDALRTELTTAVGAETAEKLTGKFEAAIKRMTESSLEPIRQTLDTQAAEAALEQSKLVLEAFNTAHPDWKTHEKRMMEIGNKLSPQGMDEGEYLDNLYYLATRDVSDADKTKKVIERMDKGARVASSPAAGSAGSTVRSAPAKAPSLDAAIKRGLEAARRGERYQY